VEQTGSYSGIAKDQGDFRAPARYNSVIVRELTEAVLGRFSLAVGLVAAGATFTARPRRDPTPLGSAFSAARIADTRIRSS
jgi:hypothetical protein